MTKKEKSLEKAVPSMEESSTSLVESLKQILQSEDNIFDLPSWYLDTGNYGLNYIISGDLNGGYTSGLVSELFGDPSTGKTLLMMVAVANIQKMGGIAVVNDVERRWDWKFAKMHGVNVDDVIKAFPETIEEFTIHTDKLLDEILKSQPIPKFLVILDSVASISTIWEMENVGTKEDQGKKAKRIKAAMRVLPKKIARAGAILITSNHLIADPRITYGSNQITPGGKGITFQASVRIEMRKPTLITMEGKNRPIGATLRMKAAKTSVCPPFGEVEVDVLWSKGVNRYGGLLEIAVDLGIIEAKGAWYSYNEKNYRSNQIAEIVRETDILNDPKWKMNYFMTGE